MRLISDTIWLKAGYDEVGELHLGDRPQAVDGGPGRGSGDHALGQRRVEHPLLAVLGEQALGGAEDAALLADVLAEDHHVRSSRSSSSSMPVRIASRMFSSAIVSRPPSASP